MLLFTGNTALSLSPAGAPIGWVDFRDVFLPLVNGGIAHERDIKRWFEIFDTNGRGRIGSQE